MKRFALAVMLLFCALPAFAAPPSDAQVDELLVLMRVRQTLDTILPQVQASQQQMVQQLIADRQLSAEARQKLDRITEKSAAHVRAALAWERLQPLYRDIYRQTFSAEDIAAMSDFYRSPAGQNLLDKMPQLMQNTMAAMQKLIVPMLQQMQQEIAAEAGIAPAAPETAK